MEDAEEETSDMVEIQSTPPAEPNEALESPVRPLLSHFGPSVCSQRIISELTRISKIVLTFYSAAFHVACQSAQQHDVSACMKSNPITISNQSEKQEADVRGVGHRHSAISASGLVQ